MLSEVRANLLLAASCACDARARRRRRPALEASIFGALPPAGEDAMNATSLVVANGDASALRLSLWDGARETELGVLAPAGWRGRNASADSAKAQV